MATRIIPPNTIEKFLNTSLIKNKFIEIDYWSFVHIGAGMLLFLIINQLKIHTGYKFLIVLAVFIIYEVAVELPLIGIMFRQETFINVLYDLIFGVTGFTIAYLIGRD